MDATPLPFTFRQLQYALAVAETRNFRRAAEICAVAQPSLSAQVAALEEALGASLFDRGRGGVRLTPAGNQLLPALTRAIQAARDLSDRARSLRDPLGGPLRLGVIPTVAPYALPLLAPALHAAFPALVPLWREAQTPNLVASLQAGELDAALLALEADLEDLQTLPLAQDAFHLCVARSHPLARSRGAVGLADLESERLLLLEDGHCLRNQALAACGSIQVEEQGFRATSLPTLVQMVASGLGATLLPALSLSVEAGRAAVAIRPFKRPVPFRTLGLAWRRTSHVGHALRQMGEVLAPVLSVRKGA